MAWEKFVAVADKGLRAFVFISALMVAAGCTKAPPTLDDWNLALKSVVEAEPEKALPDGSSGSEACVETRRDESCIPVAILRKPFEKLRIIRPRGQITERVDRPRLIPYILVRDGRLPSLTIAADYPAIATTTKYPSGNSFATRPNRPRIAIVINGDLAYETPDVNTGPYLFMPDKKQWEHLRNIDTESQVQLRLYYTPHDDYSEKALDVGQEDSNRFASEFRAMLIAHESISLALKHKIDESSFKGNDSIHSATERVGIVGWSE